MMYLVDSYIFSRSFARIVDSAGSDIGYGATVDSSGNVYLAGEYNGTPTIKDQSGNSLGTLPASTVQAAFLCKFDSSGTYQWSRIIDGSSDQIGLAVACDTTGNVYISGTYNGSPSIKTQNGTVLATLPADLSTSGAFAAKFDSSGTYLYSRLVDSTTGDCSMNGVACDASQNMYVCGSYTSGTVYVRTASNTNAYANIATLPSRDGGGAGVGPAFLCKFNSSGTYQYARIIDSAAATSGYGVICDSSSNVYFTGNHAGTTINIKNSTSSNVVTTVATLPPPVASSQAFCSKFNSSGTYLYSRLVDGTSTDVSYSATSDPTGAMYFCGLYISTGTGYIRTSSNANVYANVAQLPSVSNGAAFASKFDASGSYQYSRLVDSVSTTTGDYGYSVTCDPSGNMYLAGNYTGTPSIRAVNSSNVASTISSLPASSAANSAAFVSKFDSSGTYQYSRIVDSIGVDQARSVACDSSGNLFLAGRYNGTPDIENQAGTVLGSLPASTSDAAFLIKFSPDGAYTA